MKNKFFVLVALLTCILLSFVLVSCDDTQNGSQENMTGIRADSILIEDGVYIIKVDNDVVTYNLVESFLPKITFNEGVTTKFSSKSDYSDDIGKTMSLNEGNNYIYLRVTDENGNKADYTFNIYRKRMLTVTFDPAGGVMEKTTLTVVEGEKITVPTVVRVGYKLNCWDFDFKNPIIDNVTTKAIWAPNSYKITVNIDGEKTECPVVFGAIPTNLPSAYKNGYAFAGWKIGNSTFNANAAYDFDRDIEIVASFELVTYNVQYVLGYEGASNTANTLTSFDAMTKDYELAPATFDDKHIFMGWYTDAGFSESSKITVITADMIGSDIVLYAKWNTVSGVTFDSNGGTCSSESVNIAYNDEYTLPTPTLENYVFDGWYNGDVRVSNTGVWTISGDVTLVAKWTPRQNSIEYVLGYPDATNNPNNPTSYDVEDGAVELLSPTFDDKHIFAGWYTDPNFTEESKIISITADNVTEKMTLYAKWNTVSTVTFVTDSDTTIDSITIAFGEDYELPSLSKDKYTFVGWFDGNDKQVYGKGNWSYEVDVTLTAKWVEKEYNISYVTNGGSIDGEYSGKYTISTDFDSLIIPTPIKEFATFGGWYFDAELTVPFTTSEFVNYEGVTLYAKWQNIEVTVNYDADGGSISKITDTVVLGDDYVLLTTEKPGYHFDGWYDENGNRIDTNVKWTDGNALVINLKAKWSIETYEITYDLDGGTTSSTLVTKYDITTEDIKLPTLTKSGLHFVGWLMDDGNTSASVVIKKGSTGNRTFKAVWTSVRDTSTGLLFAKVDDKFVVVGIEREINDSIKAGVKIPAYYDGIEVVGIDSYAFKAFGEKFTKTKYANMSNSYVTFSVPTTVKKIGEKAFESCNGIKVVLYDPSQAYADYKTWDTMVTWESGNRSARDCIWGFRPAIGWTRYSKVTIPDGYDDVTN